MKMTSIANKGNKPIYIGGDSVTGFKLDPGFTICGYPIVTSSVQTKFYTMPDGNKTTREPADGEVFKHQTDPYNYDEWIYDRVKRNWTRAMSQGSLRSFVNPTLQKAKDLKGSDDWYEGEATDFNGSLGMIEPKCDCGTAAACGPDYPIDKHSDWCKLQDSVIEIDL